MAKTLALWVIAVCYLAQTFSYYNDESGGLVLSFGNLGYYFEGADL
jgi:hypothetical protein